MRTPNRSTNASPRAASLRTTLPATDGRLATVCRAVLALDEINPELVEAYEMGRAELAVSLRMAQVQSALRGDVSMQRWLGANILGQRAKVDHFGGDAQDHIRKEVVIPVPVQEAEFRHVVDDMRESGCLPGESVEEEIAALEGN